MQLRLSEAPNGTAAPSFRIVNHGTDELQFRNIIAWRGFAEIAAEHLSKGRPVYVGGRLHSRSWTGQDGVGRYAIEIIDDEIQFLTPKRYRAPEAAAARAGSRGRDLVPSPESSAARWQQRPAEGFAICAERRNPGFASGDVGGRTGWRRRHDDYFVSGCRCAPLALPDVWWHRAEIALEICSWHHDNIH